jgi:hypothetical protein
LPLRGPLDWIRTSHGHGERVASGTPAPGRRRLGGERGGGGEWSKVGFGGVIAGGRVVGGGFRKSVRGALVKTTPISNFHFLA